MTYEELEQKFITCAGVRANTMVEALRAVEASGHTGEFIETGTWRGCAGDGFSTCLFGTMAAYYNKTLSSVDLDPGHVAMSIQHAQEHPEANINVVLADSVDFLSTFGGVISFLYLDSFDYASGAETLAQWHNLAEAAAVSGKMAHRSVILCDDNALAGGGKPLLTKQWLASRGWTIAMDTEQVLLTNFGYNPKA